MSSEPQATQIHLLRHQRTEIPPTKFQRKQNKRFKQRQLPKQEVSRRSVQRKKTSNKRKILQEYSRVYKF